MSKLDAFIQWVGARWRAQNDPNRRFIQAIGVVTEAAEAADEIGVVTEAAEAADEIGVVTEAAEAADEIKKSLRTWCPKPLDLTKLKLELGDALNYWAAICVEYGLDPDEIMELNMDKLTKRESAYAAENTNKPTPRGPLCTIPGCYKQSAPGIYLCPEHEIEESKRLGYDQRLKSQEPAA